MDIFKLKHKQLTAENILSHVSEYDIYSLYLGNFIIGAITNSPFREDKNPSFGVYESYSDGKLLFNDFRLGAGNVFQFVSLIENVNFLQALSIINQQFNLGLADNVNVDYKKKTFTKYNVKKTDKIHKNIHIKVREFNQKDIDYFNPLEPVRIHNLYAISKVWINGYAFDVSPLAYAYRYSRNIYKIYQPLDITYKWITNISPEVQWYGMDILPKKGELLFVASSNKDAAVFHHLGYNAIAPHTEAQKFSQEQYDDLSSRFDRIIIFYDNDETGILKAEQFSKAYNLDYLVLEEESTKDPFEYVKQYDLETFNEWLKQWI